MSHAKQRHNRRYLHNDHEIIKRTGLPGTVNREVCAQVQDAVSARGQTVSEPAVDKALRASLG